MYQNIQFRNCIHRGVVGPTPEAAVAAILGEECIPASVPAEADKVFIGVVQVLGASGFRAIWSTFQAQASSRLDPRRFADFLAGREPGPLAELARFDFAYFLAAQPSQVPSVGACCLPESMIREHPDMVLRFQPGWSYVNLAWPVHRLPAESLSMQVLQELPGPMLTGVRVCSDGYGVDIAVLPPASFALESALRSGRRLSEAAAEARAIDADLDPAPAITRLVAAGAIVDAVLHPAERSPLPITRGPEINPNHIPGKVRP